MEHLFFAPVIATPVDFQLVIEMNERLTGAPSISRLFVRYMYMWNPPVEAVPAVACQGCIHGTGWYFLQCQSGSVVFQADPLLESQRCVPQGSISSSLTMSLQFSSQDKYTFNWGFFLNPEILNLNEMHHYFLSVSRKWYCVLGLYTPVIVLLKCCQCWTDSALLASCWEIWKQRFFLCCGIKLTSSLAQDLLTEEILNGGPELAVLAASSRLVMNVTVSLVSATSKNIYTCGHI